MNSASDRRYSIVLGSTDNSSEAYTTKDPMHRKNLVSGTADTSKNYSDRAVDERRTKFVVLTAEVSGF